MPLLAPNQMTPFETGLGLIVRRLVVEIGATRISTVDGFAEWLAALNKAVLEDVKALSSPDAP
jgi:hypothetical protein